MSPAKAKHKKGKSPAKETKKKPKSDMLMSEDMEQGLMVEHHRHKGSVNKGDFYNKKVTPRHEKS